MPLNRDRYHIALRVILLRTANQLMSGCLTDRPAVQSYPILSVRHYSRYHHQQTVQAVLRLVIAGAARVV